MQSGGTRGLDLRTTVLSTFALNTEVGLSRFVDFSRLVNFFLIIDLILLALTNRQNTGSGAFHRRESIKRPSKQSASVWTGLRNITKYKTPPPQSVENQQLADDLNVFYCRFEKARLTPSTRSDPHFTHSPLHIDTCAYRPTQSSRVTAVRAAKRTEIFCLSFGHLFGIIALISTSYHPLVILNLN